MSDINVVKRKISSIPAEKWENNLPIGRLVNVKIQKIIKRQFSHVSKCEISGTSGMCVVYVKIFHDSFTLNKMTKKEAVINEFDTLNFWYSKFKNSEQYSVVRPVFVIPDSFIIVTEEVKGIPLSNLIHKKINFFSSSKNIEILKSHLFNIGGWLKFFHSLDSSMQGTFSIDQFIEYVDFRLKILTEEKARKFPLKYRDKILDFIEKNRPQIGDEELKIALSHGDFNLGNIIVDGNKVTVLDFGKVVPNSFLLDLARSYHQLYLLTLKPSYPYKYIVPLQKSLIKGFGLPEGDQLMMFKFLQIRHTLTHLVTITRFWQKGLKERIYNYWVLYNELKYLDSFLY